MDPEQQEAFKKAVERKKAEAQEASEAPDPNADGGSKVTLDATGTAQPGLQTDDRSSQDTFSVRDKNSGHGKKTADKWNQ
jgi:hypothetical protein